MDFDYITMGHRIKLRRKELNLTQAVLAERLNVSQSCINVSEEKQMLLFLIDEEYTTPVKTLFHENHVLEYKLVESESEKQIEIREM